MIALQARHNQQKFIAAVTHQFIGRAYILFQRRRERRENGVARNVPVYVVVHLEIIQIDHRDARRRKHGIFQFFFVKAAVVYPRQHVGIRLFVVPVEAGEKLFFARKVQKRFRIEFAQQFHYAWNAVDFRISCDCLIYAVLRKFQLYLVFFALIRAGRNAVIARTLRAPERIARAVEFFRIFPRTYPTDFVFMQNPHHVEYLAVTTHLFFGFRHGKNAFFLHDFLPACSPARQNKLRRTTTIRSAAFCSMPLAVCRKIPARRILRRTTSTRSSAGTGIYF